ncbi:MAG: hypothetical protein ACUZ9M_00520 [Candidatus Scalindua sp.]
MKTFKTALCIVIFLLIVSVTMGRSITKKIWLSINPKFESIEDFRKQSIWNVDKVIEIEVSCGVETKQFTYEEFYSLLGFGLFSKDTPALPYIYEDPIVVDANSVTDFNKELDIVCTKHGRLRWSDAWYFEAGGKMYCSKCAHEVAVKYLDKHIGVDPNV